MIAEILLDLFGELPKAKRRALVHRLTETLSDQGGTLSDEARQWLLEGAAGETVDVSQLELHQEDILALLARHMDIPDEYLFLFGPKLHLEESKMNIRMQVTAFGSGPDQHASDGFHVRIPDLAISSTHLARMHANYQVAVMHLDTAIPVSEPTVAVSHGSISLSLSSSGFGVGLAVVILALAGATFPISAPAWAYAASGAALAGTSALNAIPEAIKTWEEALKTREERKSIRERREREQQETSSVGLAESLGIPDEHVKKLAADHVMSAALAYHLINRVGPAVLDAANDGVAVKIGHADAKTHASTAASSKQSKVA